MRPGALGLDDHRLGTAMAEALLHRAGADRSGPAGLQGQGLASARGGVAAVVVLVAHALALLTDRAVPAKRIIKYERGGNRLRFPLAPQGSSRQLSGKS